MDDPDAWLVRHVDAEPASGGPEDSYETPAWPERGVFVGRVAGWKGLRRAVFARPTGAPHGNGARTRLEEVLTAHRSVERPASQR